jgi:hypothetical protein
MSAPGRTSTVDPVSHPPGWLSLGFVAGVAAPLAVAAAAYVLWWVSDRLIYIGPFDRAAFGWIVVIPLWLATPVAAAVAWRRLTSRDIVIAAGVTAATIGAAAAILFWQSVSLPSCEFGAIRSPGDWVLPSVILGAVIGGGLGVSALLASRVMHSGRRWQGAIVGAGTEAVMVVVAILAAGMMVIGPGCQRPPI